MNPDENKVAAGYRDKGFFFPIQILDKNELIYFQNAYQEHLEILGSDPSLNRLAQLHLHFRWAYELARHPNILKYIKPILGPDVLIHGSRLFYKSAYARKHVSWHQDGYYLNLNSFEYLTAWISLAHSKKENGCLRAIPETHKHLYEHVSSPTKGNLLSSGLTVKRTFNESHAVDFELKPGEMSLHHVNLVHGSEPNTSDQPRVGFAIRYISTKVSQNFPHHPVMLASGSYDGTRHYELSKEIPGNDLQKSIVNQKKAHEAYKRRRSEEFLYKN